MCDKEILSQNFKQLTDMAPAILTVLDAEKQLTWGNRAWRDYAGECHPFPLPMGFAIHDDDLVPVVGRIEAAYENPRQIILDLRYRRRDGQYRSFQLRGSPWLEDGRVKGMICVMTDITDQKMVEEELFALNDSLEEIVACRTKALRQANDELKEAQSQMLQREKMASIGQLAAGVAHEVNNPIGFITSNLGSLGKYMERLTGFIAAQDVALIADDPCRAREDLGSLRRKLKLDYILDDIGQLIEESLDGAERVKKIVQDLKTFSRVDDTDCTVVDLTECLESSLNIAWNELKYKVTLEKDYGEIPPVRCYPQQLNQVFLNLLINAAHAIEGQGRVTLRTWQANNSVFISVSDTGVGIPEAIRSRIFEPFFTTKEVGKGTGLGLSISYDIVKKHGGEITVDSAVGKGTTFVVKLPFLNQVEV